MKELNKILLLVFAACFTLTCCKDDFDGGMNNAFEEGTYTIQFAVAGGNEIVTRTGGSSDGDDRLENALVFAFDSQDKCVAKQWGYLEGNNTVSMYLPSTAAKLRAVCNLLDPETVMNSVSVYSDLEKLAVTINEPDGAYKGKYVMSNDSDVEISDINNKSFTINLSRLAAQFNVNVKFIPTVPVDEFILSGITLYNIPKGSWIFSKTNSLIPGIQKGAEGEKLAVKTSDGGDMADYVYSEIPALVKNRYFGNVALDWTEGTTDVTIGCKMNVNTSFSIFENRRGTLDATDEGKSINWPELIGNENMEAFAQLWKRDLAISAGLDYATYMEIKGVYSKGGKNYEVSYYVYLGKDNFSDYNVCRNTRYGMEVTIRTIDEVDTRVEDALIEDIKVYYNEDKILDTHFNMEKALLYAPYEWEMWVEDPDENPWLELSLEPKYVPHKLGETAADEGGYSTGKTVSRLSGKAGIMYFYIHTDEYIPVIDSPLENRTNIRSARVAYRSKKNGGYTETKYFTVKQYPAQMVVLHIKYDVHTMKEVRDTFYVERVLEKKNLKWGFEHYWSFVTDDLIASGMWDGLSNTRKLYDVALNGDKWGVKPAYPDGVIPSDVALSNVIEKNRDRNGSGKIDYNEIVWYMPAVYELQALQEALAAQNVTFEGEDDFFFSSTPSSADPAGITTGFAWYVKMQNGKSALAQRDCLYNVIALRRKNAWKGPETAGGNGSVDKNDEWDEEEVIMPKY